MRRKRYSGYDDDSIDVDELKWLWFAIESEGGIFIGSVGDSLGVLASDGTADLAKLKIIPGETMSSILSRLNNAIEQSVEKDIVTDELDRDIAFSNRAPD